MNEAAKNLLLATIREWTKYTTERDKFTALANELAAVTRKVVQEALAMLKAQNVDVQCDSPEALKILKVPVEIVPVIDAPFPTVKASVSMKCGGAHRTILINPNLTIAAGGAAFAFDALKRGIPDPFWQNAAEFVRDAFLNVARAGGKEQPDPEKPPAA
jgi:hypothetical protein